MKNLTLIFLASFFLVLGVFSSESKAENPRTTRDNLCGSILKDLLEARLGEKWKETFESTRGLLGKMKQTDGLPPEPVPDDVVLRYLIKTEKWDLGSEVKEPFSLSPTLIKHMSEHLEQAKLLFLQTDLSKDVIQNRQKAIDIAQAHLKDRNQVNLVAIFLTTSRLLNFVEDEILYRPEPMKAHRQERLKKLTKELEGTHEYPASAPPSADPKGP